MSSPNQPQRPRRGLLWLLFRAPGALVLWWQYHFPKAGDAWASARRKDNPTMELLYSLFVWAVLVIVVLAFVFGKGPNQ